MEAHERFTLLWTAAQPVVGSYIGSLVPDFQEAEDLLQEVALVLLRKFPVAWALGVARFEVLHARRRHARSFVAAQSNLLENVTAACTELAPELDRRASALRECLRMVQGRAAELIRLRRAGPSGRGLATAGRRA